MAHISLSPRIVPLALFDPASYIAGGYTGTNGVAKVMNMVGFFVEGMCDVVYPVAATRPSTAARQPRHRRWSLGG